MTINMERPMATAPADWVPGPKQGHWTYNHYAALPDDGHRYEVVDGVLYMSPSPKEIHQDAVLWLAYYLIPRIRVAGLGRVYLAPFDVELMPNTVVQPDVMVVLNTRLDRITSSHIKGAPDLVIEVLSPGTALYDRSEKQNVYAHAGVTEYWLADPGARTIEVLFLEGEKYQSAGIFSGQDSLLSNVVPTIAEVHVEQFFA